MNNSIDKIKDRIKKLLRMAADTSSPNEAAIAANRARKLMSQHQISNADFVLDELSKEGALIQSTAGRGFKSIPGWYQTLSVSIAECMDCHAIINRRWTACTIVFRGYQPDVEMASWLLDYLGNQIEQQATAHRKAVSSSQSPPWPYTRSPRTYMNSFRNGLSAGIKDRMAKFYSAPEATHDNTANQLVLAKSDALKRAFGEVTYETRTVNANQSAWAKGLEASDRVSIAKAIDKETRMLT